MCQNHPLATAPTIELPDDWIIQRFLSNDISKAVIFGGLEPFDQFEELFQLISKFRAQTLVDIVIFTGYTEQELPDKIELLSQFKNIIIKYGRYIPNQKSHYDEVLGIELASNNQYAKRIS